MDLSGGQAVDARRHRRYQAYFKSELSATQAPEGSGLIMDLSSGWARPRSECLLVCW